MKKFFSRYSSLIRVVAILLLLSPLVYTTFHRWLSVRGILLYANWFQVVIGVLLLMLAQPLMGVISWVVLRHLGQFFGFLKIFYIYFASQAAKYLPGGIWAFPGRVVAYQAVGVEGSASFISMVREVGVLFVGAALVGLVGLFTGLNVDNWVRIAIIAGIGICVFGVFLVQLPRFWSNLKKISFLKNINTPDINIKSAGFSFNWLPLPMVISLLFWIITGFAFRELTVGIAGVGIPIGWFQSASIFALAWCAGFVIVIAPAGLGVRETVLSALLSRYMPLETALSTALIARLWWTLGEAFFIIFSVVKIQNQNLQLKIPRGHN